MNMSKTMNILLWIVIWASFILMWAFILGKSFVYKHVKNLKFVSRYSVFIGFLYLLHFASIIVFSIACWFSPISNAYAFVFPLYLPIPFLIGKFSRYEKIDFYTNLQIIALAICVLTGIALIRL